MKKHILHIFLALLLFTGTARGQIVKPVTAGLPYSQIMCTGTDSMYICTLCKPRHLNDFTLYRWSKDGFGDTIVMNAAVNSEFNCIRRFNNRLFVAGKIDTLYSIRNTNLVYYSGSSWSNWQDTGDKNIQAYTITDLQDVNNELYAIGQKTIGANVYSVILRCRDQHADSIVFTPPQKVTALTTDGMSLYALISEGDSVHVIKRINFPGSVTDASPVLNFKNSGGDLVFHDNQFFMGNGGMVFNGSKWDPDVFSDFVKGNFSVLDGRLYSIGETADPLKYQLYQWDGRRWDVEEAIQDIKKVNFDPIVTADGRMFIFQSDTIPRPGDNLLFTQLLTTNSQVRGRLYFDNNSDCVYNSLTDSASDIGVIGARKPGGNTTYKNALPDGTYTLYLDSGTQEISIVPPRYYKVTCPPLGKYTAVLFPDTIVQDLDFAIRVDSIVSDIAVSIVPTSGFRTRLGYEAHYYLVVSNPGTVGLTGQTVKLKIDKDPDFHFSSGRPFTKNGNEISFTTTYLWPMGSDTIGFSIQFDTALYHMGDTVAFTALAQGAFSDSDTTNNADTVWQLVTSAYDPNDKQSFPIDKLYQYTKEIKYHIRFQNTGNDTAIRVTVIDTFDVSLPIYEVQQGLTSHPYKVYLENNVIHWVFDKINLPDSNTNEAASHGWISFTARVTPGLAVGDSITNQAQIYFDYQEPVRTNKAVNIKVKPEETTGIPKVNHDIYLKTCKVYPNPAADQLTLENLLTRSQLVKVYDTYGREVYSEQLLPEATAIFNVSAWSNGLYILVTENQQTLKLVIQH